MTSTRRGPVLPWTSGRVTLARDPRSDDALAGLVACSRKHLNRVKNGHAMPSYALRVRFLDVLGIPLDAWDAPPATLRAPARAA